MLNRLKYAGVVAICMGASLVAMAQQSGSPRIFREGNAWVEETSGALPAARNLRVETSVGSVNVQGGAGSAGYTVRKKAFVSSEDQARRQFEEFRVSADRQGDTAVLRADFARGGANRFSAEFIVRVPRTTNSVNVNTRGGTISVADVVGPLQAETAGGGINLDRIENAVVASTMGGNITVGTLSSDATLKSAGGNVTVQQVGGRLSVTSYGGNIDVGSAKQFATVESMGGNIHVGQTGGELRATTAGGNIDGGQVSGSAVLTTAGGSIRLAAAGAGVRAQTAGGPISLWKVQRGIRASTAGGGITAELLGGQFTDSDLETSAGDITVYLSSKIACSVRAAIDMASGHKIRSDFPELKITGEGSDYGPKEWYAQGALNGGGPVLRLRTSVGDIEIRRASGK